MSVMNRYQTVYRSVQTPLEVIIVPVTQGTHIAVIPTLVQKVCIII